MHVEKLLKYLKRCPRDSQKIKMLNGKGCEKKAKFLIVDIVHLEIKNSKQKIM